MHKICFFITILILFFLSLCTTRLISQQTKEQSKVRYNNETKRKYDVDVLISEDYCSLLYFEPKSCIVDFYSSTKRFDYRKKEFYKSFKPVPESQEKLELEDGFYYYEVKKGNSGEILNKGTFELPKDEDTPGVLTLKKGRKTGFIYFDDDNSKLSNIKLLFTHEISKETFEIISDDDGYICMEMDPGRYQVKVMHPDYEHRNRGYGFNVFPLASTGTSNYFLRRKSAE